MTRWQRQGKMDDAERILKDALLSYPKDSDLKLCLAINHMNRGNFKEALHILKALPLSEETKYYIEECKKRIST